MLPVRLQGLSLRQRIKAMISIAAPEHREILAKQAKEVWGEWV